MWMQAATAARRPFRHEQKQVLAETGNLRRHLLRRSPPQHDHRDDRADPDDNAERREHRAHQMPSHFAKR
jgi:hypothetical protein